jgi:hypothetical protein
MRQFDKHLLPNASAVALEHVQHGNPARSKDDAIALYLESAF